MNKNIIIALLIILLVGGGIYFMSNKNNSNIANQNENRELQSHRSYNIEILSKTDNIKPNNETEIRFRIKNDKDEILKQFAIAHEKLMHLIIVRHDLKYFQHLHPEYIEETGEFAVNATFPTDGPYRIFPDFTPAREAENPQLLPVTVFEDINVGDTNKYQKVDLAVDKEIKKNIGKYEVTYLFPDINGINNQEEITYSLLINENGNPVTNVENYLGAKGHSVILKSGTLDYIHTHALEKEATQEGGHSMGHGAMMEEAKENQIDFATMFPESGIYKIFTQFQHKSEVQTTDYTVSVK